MRISLCILLALGVIPQLAQSQVTISSSDMYDEAGLFYKVYANNGFPDLAEGTVSVSGLLGERGGPQLWDFKKDGPDDRNFPKDRAFRFDYVKPEEVEHSESFPKAELVERMTDITAESGTAEDVSKVPPQWLFITQQPGTGRINHGFFAQLDAGGLITIPPSATKFDPPIVEFPDPMNFGDTWSDTTQYSINFSGNNEGEDGFTLGPTRMVVIRKTEAEVDAYGRIDLPEIGFAKCLRVNELLELEFQTDLTGSGLQTIARRFVRNYYWVADDLGIAAQITSRPKEGTPPADDFTSAAFFTRTFASNHPENDDQGPAQKPLELGISISKNEALLKWNDVSGVNGFRVEYTSDLSDPDSWTELDTTTGTFSVDTLNKSQKMRFYRVIEEKEEK